jgi:subtilisin family serine protease
LLFNAVALTFLLLTVVGLNAQGNPVRKIVVFNSTVNQPAQEAIIKGVGGTVLKPLPIINGMSVLLPDRASERALEERIGVLRVEEDAQVKALAKPPWAGGGNSTQPPQVLEWNIDRIDAELAWNTSRGTSVKVAIIDTGIDKDHPDLMANLKGGINFVPRGWKVDPEAWDDDNGHGTHVAGIAAAVDNEIGVIGASPEAYLYAVKVLDRTGSGYVSDVIAGIQWAIDNDMDVINMSLGTDSDIQSLHDAVDAAYAANIVVVAAAGNDGDTDPDSDVDYPAAYSSVIAVAATDSEDIRASWSSDGTEVELAAPGVEVRSTWKGGKYKVLSGTSMASPHVAGTVALILATSVPSTYDADSDGFWDPVEVRAVLQETADDLGDSGFDVYYGYGLVDSEESVTGVQTNP